MAMIATAASPPATAPAPPALVLVFAREFRFGASRAAAPAGALLLQLQNIGQDDHDLRILGPDGAPRAETGIVRPGRLAQISVRLPQGRYTYVCTVADHAAKGMAGTIVVTAARRRHRGRR